MKPTRPGSRRVRAARAPFPVVLGIMSGTSLDGVDCVLTEFDGDRPVLVGHWARRFPSGLRNRLLACASGKLDSWGTGLLHHDLGRYFAEVAVSGLAGNTVAAVGLHGQTVFHRADRRRPATLQLGEPAYLAEALGIPVVSNFRAHDLAAGGQGAPLATLFHVRVFGEPGRHVCVQNLGGIGNVTSIDARARGRDPGVLAFDTGPGNLPIDGTMVRLSSGRRRYDRDGRMASAGTACRELVTAWLRHPFLRRRPPKSTGRELFGEPDLAVRWTAMDRLGLKPADRVATVTDFVAGSIARNYRLHLPSVPDRVVLCGGGARNGFLVDRLEQGLARESAAVEIVVCTDLGWPPETVEGAAFALLARERLLGRPGNLPGTTGARRAVLCGQVTDVGREGAAPPGRR